MLEIIRSNAQSWGVKVAFGIIIVVFVFWGVGSFTGSSGIEVVNVNGETITAPEFLKRYEFAVQNVRGQNPDVTAEDLKAMDLKMQVVRQMIIQTLLLQEAQRIGLAITPVELRKRVETFPIFMNQEGRFDPSVYTEVLKAQGETPGSFESSLSKDLLMEKLEQEITAGAAVPPSEARALFDYDSERRSLDYVLFPLEDYTTGTAPSDADIKKYYDENPQYYSVPAKADVEYMLLSPTSLAAAFPVSDEDVRAAYDKEQETYKHAEMVRARHILVLAPEKVEPGTDSEKQDAEAKAAITDIHKRLLAGEDFATLARAHSADGTREQGGDLGWFEHAQMVPEFANPAFALAPGKISEPVRSPFGYHIIRVDEKKPAGYTPLDDVKDEIKTQISAARASEKLQDILDQMLLALINGKSLDAVGTEYNLKPESTGKLNANELATRLNIKPADAATLVATKSGTMRDTPIATRDGYLLTRVTESSPAGTQPLDEVKDAIAATLTRANQSKAALAAATAARGKMKDNTLPAALNAKVKTTDGTGRDGAIQGLGFSQDLGSAIFAAPIGEWLPVAFALDNGVILAKVTKVTPPSEESWKQVEPLLINALAQSKRQQMFSAFIAMLQDKATIKLRQDQPYLAY